MSSRFLDSQEGDAENLTDGSTAFYGSSLSAANLLPSFPIKTDTAGVLISTNLAIADTTGLQTALNATISNPATGDLDMGTNSITNATSIALTDQAVFSTNTGGVFNLVVGNNAGAALSGAVNVIIGDDAGTELDNNSNVLIGHSAGKFLDGVANTAIGQNSGLGATGVSTGINNTFVGMGSGIAIRAGASNTFIGANAGGSATTGKWSTCIGQGSDVSAGADNQIAIGFGATNAVDNTAVIGNAQITDISPGVATCTLGATTSFKSIALTDQLVFDITKGGTCFMSAGEAQSADVGGCTNSVVLGCASGLNISDVGGVKNAITYVGSECGKYLNGNYNTCVGTNAGLGVINTSTGQENTFMGFLSGSTILGGNFNTCVGSRAACSPSGINQIAIGRSATNTVDNTAVIGNTSITDISPGVATCTLGDITPFRNLRIGIGTENVFIDSNFGSGTQSGDDISSGIYNTCVGSLAGRVIDAGQRNTTIGRIAGWKITSGGSNTVIGYGAGSDFLTTESNNTLVGCDSGIVAGTDQGIAIGCGAIVGTNNTCVIGNTFITDISAGVATCTLGATTSFKSIALTDQAVFDTSVGTDNYSAGTGAGAVLDGASIRNILIGTSAGALITTGTRNIIIGHVSGNKTTGDDNTIVGNEAATGISNADFNTIVGSGTAPILTTGERNTILGKSAGQAVTTSENNVFVGHTAGDLIATGVGGNVCIGKGSCGTVDAINQIAIGNDAVATTDNTCVIGNTFIADISPGVATCSLGGTTSFKSIALTDQALFDVSDATGNMVARTGTHQEIGNNSLIVGFEAGTEVGSGTHSNTLLGRSAGKFLNGINNICLGYASGVGATGASTGGGNIFIGAACGLLIEKGNNNVCVGTASGGALVGLNATKGGNNVFVGTNAGDSIVEGNFNVAVGRSSDCSASAINQIAIGQGAVSATDNTAVIGNASLTSINPGTSACSLGAETSFKDVHIDGDVIKNGALYGVFTFFSQMTSKTILGSVPSVGDLFDTTNARGSVTYTANTFVQGSTNRLVMGGSLATAGNNQNLEIELRVGAVTVATTGVFSLQNLTAGSWHLDMSFAIREIGAPGVAVIATTGLFDWSNSATSDSYGKDIDNIESTNFRTDITQDFSVLVTWTSISASNNITCVTAIASKWF